MSRKTRSDSILGTLPTERQETIAAYAVGHSLEETISWLAADGPKVSIGALSNWLSSFRLSQQLKRNASTVEVLLDSARSADPTLSAEQIQQLGQSFFTAMAVEQQDAEQWRWIQSTQLKKEQLALDQKRFQRETCELFVKWSADKAAQEVLRSNTSNTEKIEQLGKLMFGEDWK